MIPSNSRKNRFHNKRTGPAGTHKMRNDHEKYFFKEPGLFTMTYLKAIFISHIERLDRINLKV
jgi:hypothetical protein